MAAKASTIRSRFTDKLRYERSFTIQFVPKSNTSKVSVFAERTGREWMGLLLGLSVETNALHTHVNLQTAVFLSLKICNSSVL